MSNDVKRYYFNWRPVIAPRKTGAVANRTRRGFGKMSFRGFGTR